MVNIKQKSLDSDNLIFFQGTFARGEVFKIFNKRVEIVQIIDETKRRHKKVPKFRVFKDYNLLTHLNNFLADKMRALIKTIIYFIFFFLIICCLMIFLKPFFDKLNAYNECLETKKKCLIKLMCDCGNEPSFGKVKFNIFF